MIGADATIVPPTLPAVSPPRLCAAPLSRRMIPLVVHTEAPGRLTMRSRRLAIVTVTLALAGLCARAASAQSTLETVKKRGKLIAGVKTDFPPFGTVDAAGKNVGFDVDVAHRFAKALFGHYQPVHVVV